MPWLQLEKLVSAYLRNPSERAVTALERRQRRAMPIFETINEHFVRTHPNLENACIGFCESIDGMFPDWTCLYEDEEQKFIINLVGVAKFHETCRQAQEAMKTLEGRENFFIYRLYAFMSEMGKLPFHLFLLLLLFHEKARVLQITQAEKRRGTTVPMEPAEEEYTRLLWSFKKLEEAVSSTNKSSLRADLQITWFEADWSSGEK